MDEANADNHGWQSATVFNEHQRYYLQLGRVQQYGTLESQPQVILIPEEAASFEFKGEHFKDTGRGHHNGFYDYLRDLSGAVVGLRYLPSSDAEDILFKIPKTKALKVAMDGTVRVLLIFWGQGQDFDPETSCDQYFGNNFIFQAERSGKLALGFGINALLPSEKISIRQEINRSVGS